MRRKGGRDPNCRYLRQKQTSKNTTNLSDNEEPSLRVFVETSNNFFPLITDAQSGRTSSHLRFAMLE